MNDVILIHINKTGGSSLRKALDIEHQPRHLTARESRLHYKAQYDNAFVFSVVRNPFDRVVSQYEYQKAMGYGEFDMHETISFDTWVHWTFNQLVQHDPRYYMPCAHWLDDIVDDVYFFEDFRSFGIMLKGDTGLSIEMPHLKKTDRRPYPEYYEKRETRETIERYFEIDLLRFGYEF